MDMELLRYFPTSKMQQATLLALWMTVAAHLMRTKTCTGKVNETSDFAIILISHQSDKTTQENQTNIILNGKWIS